jgi:hypothetical protein
MNHYKRINNLFGWIAFAISAFVYLSTIEPTGSFWDCGEFIASSYRLQVGHPPGAPLFLMLGRVFSLASGGDIRLVSVMINVLSALMSAFTILFLFWTITAIAKKIVAKSGEVTSSQLIGIMGAGLVGSLAYTFSDSFWFSAVEGEVYASSSFFTAIVFWVMFKWDASEEKDANKWIILIAYLMGLSIGIHLLNLLTIPALAFIYYFKKNKPSLGGVIKTSIVGVLILGIVQYGIISGLVSLASKFDLLFVNSFGLPFWTGFIFFLLLVIGGIFYGLKHSVEKNKPLLNLGILCFSFILLGYSSYAMIVIRSMANPPMDENNPEQVFNLLGYINREQYGDRPLFYGQYYNAEQVSIENGANQYAAKDGKYVVSGQKQSPVFDPANCTVFPRMYSSQESHIQAYKEWAGISGDGKPTFAQNLKFFWNYQIIHMYWRYFMWNFSGRQNDIQGHGGITKGNWISGITFIDEARLGPQESLPESAKNNKGYNRFYMLPFLLGVVGMIWHYKRAKQNDFWTVMLLFFFTGLAIVLYLNQYPYQPRERDYAYAASFYAFAIWIGLGTLALIDAISKKLDGRTAAILSTVICLLAAPTLMAKDGWDDHNRSHRYTSRDFAHNYLQSCAPNALIFTNGDNDTFPLWYAQDVEGIRPDIRIVNLSLLNTDWYIDQMKRKAYQSDALPISFTHEQYEQGTRDYVPYAEGRVDAEGYINLKDVMNFIKSEEPNAKVQTQSGVTLSFFPTKKFMIPVDKKAVIAAGIVKPEDANKIVDTIFWDIDKNYLMKADLMILDMIANNDWTRPIYFAVTVGSENYMNLEPYFQLEGLAYRFVPIKNPRSIDPNGQTGRVNNDIMYNNMMNKFLWGNMNKEGIYLDQTNMGMTMNFRNNFARLAESLLESGKKDSALKVLDKMNDEMPDNKVGYNVMMLRPIELYFLAAQKVNANDTLNPMNRMTMSSVELPEARRKHADDMAVAITKRMAEIYENEMDYYLSLKRTSYFSSIDRESNQAYAIYGELIRMARQYGHADVAKEMEKKIQKYSALNPNYYQQQ